MHDPLLVDQGNTRTHHRRGVIADELGVDVDGGHIVDDDTNTQACHPTAAKDQSGIPLQLLALVRRQLARTLLVLQDVLQQRRLAGAWSSQCKAKKASVYCCSSSSK